MSLKENFKGVFSYLKEKQKQRDLIERNITFNINNEIHTNLKSIIQNKTKVDKIGDYFIYKDFLNREEDEVFLFITYTLNPKHNHKISETNEEILLNTIKTQSGIWERTFRQFSKNVSKKGFKYKYILALELTKKFNIHLHQLTKINKNDLKDYIHNLKLLHNKNDFSRIEIQTNFETINSIDHDNLIIHEHQLNEEEIIEGKKRSGRRLYLKELKDKKGEKDTFEVLTYYILKYVKKGMKNSLEKQLLNYLNIKKLRENINQYKIFNLNKGEMESIEKEELRRIIGRVQKLNSKRLFIKDKNLNEDELLNTFKIMLQNKTLYSYKENHKLKYYYKEGDDELNLFEEYEVIREDLLEEIEDENEIYIIDNISKIEYVLNNNQIPKERYSPSDEPS